MSEKRKIMEKKEKKESQKSQTTISISKEVLTNFRIFLAKKYGKYEKGLLSNELEQAIVNWMTLHAKTQTFSTPDVHTDFALTKPNPPNKVRLSFEKVKKWLTSADGPGYIELTTGQHIPLIHIIQGIKASLGEDRRTVKKYLDLFEEFHLIKHIGGAMWEVM